MFGKKRPEVLIAGAGPVGLLTALELSRAGVRVQIIDKALQAAGHSYALALHPDTLEILDGVGLLGEVLEQARHIRNLVFHDEEGERARLAFPRLETDYSFVASIHQRALEHVLENALRERKTPVDWHYELADLTPGDDAVAATIHKLVADSVGYVIARTEWLVGKKIHTEFPFVVGADGYHSMVRRRLQIPFDAVQPPQHFAVFEFITSEDPGDTMHVVLRPDSINVLWPLPGNSWRWSFELREMAAPVESRTKDRYLTEAVGMRYPMLTRELLLRLIAQRAPWFTAAVDDIVWRNVVRFERRRASAFGRGRVWLAGDAAHLTGPAGVQSMNIGLREGHDLATALTRILRQEGRMELLETYASQREEEWNGLLGLSPAVEVLPHADPWVGSHLHNLLPCLPASGETLRMLAHQLGLSYATAQDSHADSMVAS